MMAKEVKKKGAKLKHSNETIIKTLKLFKGHIRYTARRLQITESHLAFKIKENPDIKEAHLAVKAHYAKLREEAAIEDRNTRKKRVKILPTVRIKKALIKADGYLYDAAQIVGCHVKTIRERIKESSMLQEVMEDLNTKVSEDVIKALLFNIKTKKDARAIEYFLKCKAKAFGFGLDKDGKGGNSGSITINVMPAPGVVGDKQTITISKTGNLEGAEDATIVDQKLLPPSINNDLKDIDELDDED